jgi:hypothetical protein
MFGYSTQQPATVECNEGFSVRILGRAGLTYREGERQLLVNSELLTTPSGMVIYTNSIKAWQPPFEQDEIDATKKAQIIDNIRRAFRWAGYEIEVQ